MSTLGVTSRGPGFEEGVDYNTMNSMVGMASLGFKVADSSLQPPQAIAILSAGNQVEDEFNGFERVKSIDGKIHIDGVSYRLNDNKAYNKDTKKWDTDANILMYSNGEQYILQFKGKLVHITDPSSKRVDAAGVASVFTEHAFNHIDSQTDIDGFIAFAEKMGIDKHTVLGAKIILKTLMSAMGYDMSKLDEAFMDPQADYLAFINQTLSPVIEAGLTATMSGLKSSIEFLKKIVQKASS